MSSKDKKLCTFCGLSEDEVATLIQGPKVWICNGYVELCKEILDNNREYNPVSDKTITIELPTGNVTIGDLRKAMSKHHYDTKITVELTK